MFRQSISFTHGNKSFSLEPVKVISLDNTTLDIKKDKAADGRKKNNNIQSKLFIIDGRLHSLSENPSRKSRQSAELDKGGFYSVMKMFKSLIASITQRLN